MTTTNFYGPFKMSEEIVNDEHNYSLYFDWDESFDDRGLTITRIDETNGEPGSCTVIGINRQEAEKLADYLFGVLRYRKR